MSGRRMWFIVLVWMGSSALVFGVSLFMTAQGLTSEAGYFWLRRVVMATIFVPSLFITFRKGKK